MCPKDPGGRSAGVRERADKISGNHACHLVTNVGITVHSTYCEADFPVDSSLSAGLEMQMTVQALYRYSVEQLDQAR